MKADNAGSIHLVVLKNCFLLIVHYAKPWVYRANTLDIATDNKPQSFVSSGSGTDNDKTVY